jgi:hypothetical protein
MATISTNQEPKQVIVPGDPDVKPYTVYHEKYIWDLDPTTLVPVNVRVEKTFS